MCFLFLIFFFFSLLSIWFDCIRFEIIIFCHFENDIINTSNDISKCQFLRTDNKDSTEVSNEMVHDTYSMFNSTEYF